MFARWHPEVLHDYIGGGLEPAANGHTLTFRRDIETAIYNTLPPVRQVGMRATQRLTHGQVSWIDGSHLFPFEKPAETAAEVLRWLALFSAPSTLGTRATPHL